MFYVKPVKSVIIVRYLSNLVIEEVIKVNDCGCNHDDCRCDECYVCGTILDDENTSKHDKCYCVECQDQETKAVKKKKDKEENNCCGCC